MGEITFMNQPPKDTKISDCCQSYPRWNKLMDEYVCQKCGNACCLKIKSCEAQEESINYLQTGDYHCFKCHKTFPPDFGIIPHTLDCSGEIRPCKNWDGKTCKFSDKDVEESSKEHSEECIEFFKHGNCEHGFESSPLPQSIETNPPDSLQDSMISKLSSQYNFPEDWDEDEKKLREKFEKFWHDKLEYGKHNYDHNRVSTFWITYMKTRIEEEENKFRKILNSGRAMYDVGRQEERIRIRMLIEGMRAKAHNGEDSYKDLVDLLANLDRDE